MFEINMLNIYWIIFINKLLFRSNMVPKGKAHVKIIQAVILSAKKKKC